MSRGNLSKELLDELTEFLCCEIGGKVLDGITYVMTLKGTKDNKFIAKYAKIREEADKCGYDKTEAFRVFELSNGYIFDMDLSIAKYITKLISKKVLVEKEGIPEDLISNNPNKRRTEDMIKLAKKSLNAFKKGQTKLEVALFNRNSTSKIIITGNDKSSNKNKVVVQYDAFAIRHWDIEEINDKYLIPRGMKIYAVEACEILSSRSGVRYILHFEKVGRV